MGASHSTSHNSNSGIDGSTSLKEPASITPIGRGPNGELIYNSHDKNGGGGVGYTTADPILIPHRPRKCLPRGIGMLSAFVAALCIILTVLVAAIAVVLANRSGGDVTDNSVNGNATTAPTPATAATTLMPSMVSSPSPSFRSTQLRASVAPTPLEMIGIPTVAPATDEPTRTPFISRSCSLCVDGLPVAEEYRDNFALTSVTTGQEFSCGELEVEIDSFTDDCFILQLLGGYRCGCSVQPHPDSVCSLCPGGGLPPNEFIDAEIGQIGSGGLPLTCQDLYLEAAQFGNTTSACRIYQSRGSQCGCPDVTQSPLPPSLPTPQPTTTVAPSPAPTGPCTLCSDGSLVQPDYHSDFAVSTIAGRNLTCLQLEIEISTFVDACVDLQIFGAYHCGCPLPELETFCPLCPGGAVPPKEFRQTQLDELGSLGLPLTCRDLFLSGYSNTNRTESECEMFQSDFAPQCGC